MLLCLKLPWTGHQNYSRWIHIVNNCIAKHFTFGQVIRGSNIYNFSTMCKLFKMTIVIWDLKATWSSKALAFYQHTFLQFDIHLKVRRHLKPITCLTSQHKSYSSQSMIVANKTFAFRWIDVYQKNEEKNKLTLAKSFSFYKSQLNR